MAQAAAWQPTGGLLDMGFVRAVQWVMAKGMHL